MGGSGGKGGGGGVTPQPQPIVTPAPVANKPKARRGMEQGPTILTDQTLGQANPAKRQLGA